MNITWTGDKGPYGEPTPIDPNRKDRPMDKWECLLCGYVYDPEEGDASQDVAPGTSFEDLPDDWVCPDCGASKDDFAKVA